MKLQTEKRTSLALTLMLLASFIAIGIPAAHAQATTLELVPTPQQAFALGEQVTFSAYVDNVTDLYGFGLKIEWNTTELLYVSHVVTVPVETYPEGVLHSPVSTVANTVDIPAGIYEAAFTSLSPALGFDGSGIIFNITFQVMYVPYEYEIPGPYCEALVEFTKDDLADSNAQPIPHTTSDGVVQLMARPWVPAEIPLLRVSPSLYEASSLGEVFDTSVLLLGEDGLGLSPDWDVAGIDVYMHYNSTLLEVLDVTIDPIGTFAAFWSIGIFEVAKDFSTPGVVHVAFIGYGEPHIAPFGVIEMFRVSFNATYESEAFPPPCTPITLLNPQTFTGQIVFDSIGGTIDTADPVGTDWFRLTPNFGVNVPYTATSWVDDNMDTILSAGDHMVLEGADGLYFNYLMDRVTATLNLTQLPFQTQDADMWAMDGSPYGFITTAASTSGLGNPRFTGNFSLTYPAVSVNYFEVNPQIGSPYNLTEGVDFVVNPDGTIDLLNTLDVDVINEFMGTMPLPDAGWPAIAYIASGFDSVWLEMPNGTNRFARCTGYRTPPPGEFWYEPPWPFEMESWWATGYYAGPWTWPDGTDVYINYTAASQITVDYNAPPDPNPRYIDFSGTFAEYLATVASDPVNSTWDEIYPTTLTDYIILGYDDNDVSTDLSVGDKIYTDGDEGLINYIINDVATNIYASKKQWICEEDPADLYFGMAPIVTIAGFPHKERLMCPWHGKDISTPLPHVVENGEICAPFKPSGGFIDIWTQYPDPFGGQGKDKPSDMFWPQKEMHICANVTTAGWPEQNKDVAFQVLDPHGQTWGIFVNRTNTVGSTCVRVRLPWPCDDPDYYFGVWTVIATVDVACIVVNDTMQFKYDYKVRIWDVTLDKTEYKHCEDINVTINFGSVATQLYNITLAVTGVDASGVPFDFAYAVVTIGSGNHQTWCTITNGTVSITVHVEKFARPPVGTVYVVALSDLPINGGSAETPVYEIQFTILPEWA